MFEVSSKCSWRFLFWCFLCFFKLFVIVDHFLYIFIFIHKFYYVFSNFNKFWHNWLGYLVLAHMLSKGFILTEKITKWTLAPMDEDFEARLWVYPISDSSVPNFGQLKKVLYSMISYLHCYELSHRTSKHHTQSVWALVRN